MAIEVYYFSGTGNSLFVAQELKKRLPECSLIPIVHVLRSRRESKRTADVLGIVFPIYATTYPDEVRQLIELLDFDANTYVFAVSSRKCRPRVFSGIGELLARKGGRLSAARSVSMPQNYIPVFTVETQQDVERQDEALGPTLDELAQAVLDRHISIEEAKKLPIPVAIMYSLVRLSSFLNRKTRYFSLENRFYSDDRCTGCGLCERICLAERIRLEGGRPVWDARIPCRLCLACIHYCPAEAIQIKGTKTEKSGRYHHPGITAQDIAAPEVTRSCPAIAYSVPPDRTRGARESRGRPGLPHLAVRRGCRCCRTASASDGGTSCPPPR